MGCKTTKSVLLFGQVLNIDCSGFFYDISDTLVVYNT